MKHIATGATALMLTAGPLAAGAIERAPQSLGILFEAGNYVEFSAGHVSPDVSGRDAPLTAGGVVLYPGGRSSGNVARDYDFGGFGIKYQINDALSAALIVEQPFGAELSYKTFAEGGSFNLGGTAVNVDSTTYTALLRYRMENGFGIHGGLRGSHAQGEVRLGGVAYGPVNGYHVRLDGSWGAGYVIGASWEKPEIAARVSLTYNSPIEHDFDTTESLGGRTVLDGTTTTIKTPRSWTLEGQTGVAPDTLAFGSIRWVKWSEFKVRSDFFTSLPTMEDGLVILEDTTTYILGVGHKFTPNWSGLVALSYEKAGDRLVSPLAPTTGRKGISLAGVYTRDKWKITTGLTYMEPGDARPATGIPYVARMSLRDSDMVAVAVKVGYSF